MTQVESFARKERADSHDVRILLADDDPQVRDFMARILSRQGWNVVAVADGRQALKAWPEGGEAFDLVILDVVMPEMNGIQVYERLLERHSAVRVLFISGFMKDLDMRRITEEGKRALISKPFLPDTLVEKVRERLSEPPGEVSLIRD